MFKSFYNCNKLQHKFYAQIDADYKLIIYLLRLLEIIEFTQHLKSDEDEYDARRGSQNIANKYCRAKEKTFYCMLRARGMFLPTVRGRTKVQIYVYVYTAYFVLVQRRRI